MKTNKQLGFRDMLEVRSCVASGDYSVGEKNGAWRACGYEWHSEQDASRETAHHEVCGRGRTAQDAVEQMIKAAIRAGRVKEGRYRGLTEDQALRLRDEMLEDIKANLYSQD